MKKNVKNSTINPARLLQLTWLTVVLLLVVPTLANAQSGKTDFSGTWAFNPHCELRL